MTLLSKQNVNLGIELRTFSTFYLKISIPTLLNEANNYYHKLLASRKWGHKREIQNMNTCYKKIIKMEFVQFFNTNALPNGTLCNKYQIMHTF